MSFSSIVFWGILLYLLSYSTNTTAYVGDVDCSDDKVYDINSTSGRIYGSNLKFLISTLASSATLNGFYNFTAGNIDSSNHTGIYGLFLCRGDVNNNDCQKCVVAAGNEILQRCSGQKNATIWYDECMLRYSNESIFSILDMTPAWYMYLPTQNVTDTAIMAISSEINKISITATKNTSGKKFALGEVEASTLGKLYTLAQCTPDISSSDCAKCLRFAISYLPKCFSNQQSSQVLLRSCYIKYRPFPFHKISTPSLVPKPHLPPPPPPKGKP